MGISGVGQPSSSPKHLQRPRRLWAARPASRAGPWTQAGTRLPAGPHHCGPHGPSLPTCHQEAAAGLVPQGPWEEALRGPPRTGPFPSHSPVCSCRRGQGRTPRFLCSDPQSTAGSPLPGSAVFWGCTQGGGHLAGSQTVPTARTLEGHALMRAGSQDAGGSGGPEYLVPFRDTEAPETQVAGARHLLRTRSSRAHAWPVRTQGHRRRAEPEVPGPRATRRLGPGTEHVVRGHVSRSRVCWEEPAPCTEPTGRPRAADGASPWQAVPATAVGPRLPSPRVTDRQGQSSS